MLVAVGNGPSFGGGLRITEGALLDDGLLDVVVIKPMSKAEAGPHLPEAVQGHPHDAPGSTCTTACASVTVAAPGIVSYADGERFGPLPLTVECVPGALKVLASGRLA